MIRALPQAALEAEGERLGASLAPGSVVTLAGEFGAGKTTFVRALARGLGVAEVATSPSYALVHRYAGRRGPVFHLDCWRLKDPEEAADLDWAGLLDEGDALLIEWPERAGAWLPPVDLRVTLHHLDAPDVRGLEVG